MYECRHADIYVSERCHTLKKLRGINKNNGAFSTVSTTNLCIFVPYIDRIFTLISITWKHYRLWIDCCRLIVLISSTTTNIYLDLGAFFVHGRLLIMIKKRMPNEEETN